MQSDGCPSFLTVLISPTSQSPELVLLLLLLLLLLAFNSHLCDFFTCEEKIKTNETNQMLF